MTSTVTRARRLLPALAAAATLVAVAACASSAPQPTATADQSPSAAASSTSAAPSDASSPTSQPSQSASSMASTQQGNDALLAAAQLAADTVSGSTVASVEQERDGWEVNVDTDDGDEQKLRTDAAGTSVVSGPTDERPDADDRAENKRFAKVSVDYRDAVGTVESEVDGGVIAELNLDADRSGVVWEADVTAGSQRRSVQLDADSGKVLSNRADD